MAETLPPAPAAPRALLLRRRQAVAGAVVLLLPNLATADERPLLDAAPAAPERDRSSAENYSVAVEGSDVARAGAAIGIHAPMADVKRVLLAFHGYKDIFPRLKQSRVVNETPVATDVYLRAPIMNGLAAIWGVARFQPVQSWRNRGILLEGALVSGNVEKWSSAWMAFPCGERRTLLKLELYCELGLPIPARIINKWLLWACRKSVSAVRDIAECGRSRVADD